MAKAKTNTPTYKLIVGADAINAAIKSIATRGKKLDRDIQVAALSAMQHHVECGDTTLINRLIEAMPKGSRVNALREYIETFGAVAYNTEKKCFVHSKTKAARMDAAQEVMWVNFKPEHEYQPITDPMQAVHQLVARFEKDMEKMGTESKVTPELLTALRAMKPEHVPAH